MYKGVLFYYSLFMKSSRNLLLVALFATALIVIFVILSANNKLGVNDLQNNTNKALLVKRESWGPCPTDAYCSRTSEIYYSGKLVVKGSDNYETQIEQKRVKQIINRIKRLGLMTKDCGGPTVLDYYVKYEISIDNNKRTIVFPGCKSELQQIEELIPELKDGYEHGA